jgi:hypothetical protein
MSTDYRAELQLLFDAADSFVEPALGHHRPWAKAMDRARAALAQPELVGASDLPPNYIDFEHTGQDQKLLETFYRACQSEGGTADEIHLRGLKAVWALAQPEPEGVIDDELLRTYGLAKRDYCYEGPSDDWPKRAERAATIHGLRAVLARYSRPTITPVSQS